MSRESIIQALPEDYVRRMRNWAKADAGSMSYAMTSAYEGERSDGYDSHMPILLGEAQDTHAALGAVPNRERIAVVLFWQYEGNSIRWIGRRLEINEKTVEVRLRDGHALHLEEIRRMVARHNAIVEANRLAMATYVPGAHMTGSISMVKRLKALDIPKIPQ